MSMWKWIVGVVAFGVVSLTVQAGEDFYLVKVKGFDKQVETEVISAAEFKALESAIKLEQKLLPKAVAEAGKEWRADEFNKGIPFAGNKVTPRIIMSATKYASQDKANEALTKFEDLQSKKAERDSKKKTEKTKEQLKQEGDLAAVAAVVKNKLEELSAKGGADDKGGAAGVEAPGGAKVNAAVEKVRK